MRMRERFRDIGSTPATLRRRLDRSVAVANVVRLAGWLGRAAVVALVARFAVTAVDLLAAPRGLAIDRWLVVAVVLLGAAAAWWRGAGRTATRLDVARDAEIRHPELGERLSRAVAFLIAPADATREPPLTRGLRELALADAAEAAAAIRRLPVPGLSVHAPWAALGSVAVIVLLASLQRMPSTPLNERHSDAPARETSAAAPPLDHLSAAARLAAVAAVESHVAEVLAKRFATAPGRSVESLPDDQRRDLATLAEIHGSSLRAMRLVRAELAASHGTFAREAAVVLEAIEDTSPEDIGDAITANQLASAAAAAGRFAAVLAAVARSLGGEESPEHGTGPHLPPHEVARVRRAEATLAEIEQRPLDGPLNVLGRRSAVVAASQTADRSSLPTPADRSVASDSGQPAGVTTAAPTSEPRFAAVDAESSRPSDEATRPEVRVWSLLPESMRPYARSGGEAEVSPEYRAAVDLYYQLVLESLLSASTGKPAP